MATRCGQGERTGCSCDCASMFAAETEDRQAGVRATSRVRCFVSRELGNCPGRAAMIGCPHMEDGAHVWGAAAQGPLSPFARRTRRKIRGF